MVLDADVGHGQNSRGEILCRGDGALQRVGIEAHLALSGDFVFLHQSFADESFAEILAHHRFQRAAAQRQLAGC